MQTPLAWIFLLSLFLSAACSEEPGKVDKGTGNARGDDDDDDEDDSSEDDDDDDDDDSTPPAKRDSGATATGSKSDSGAASKSDAGAKSDAGSTPSTTPSDAGAPKGDSGPSSTNADGGAKADAGSEPPASDKPLPKCVMKDSQVIIIGDSYILWDSHDFPGDLAENSGQQWRMEAVGGTAMATGGVFGLIPPQFSMSIARDPDAHTVLMDGGGNDAMLPDSKYASGTECTSSGASQNEGCREIVDLATTAAGKLMEDMAAEGIRDVVYFFYPNVPANTILSGDDPSDILSYSLPLAQKNCEGMEERTNGELRCTFIDMRPVFDGHPDYFNADVHPNTMGGKAMADKVWEVMTDKCIGQKGPKDCCES